MNHTERLPEGIELLRKFEEDNGAAVSRHRFEELVDSLNECAANSKPKATKCNFCPYIDECLSRFDAICGRVAMYGQ